MLLFIMVFGGLIIVMIWSNNGLVVAAAKVARQGR